MIKNKLKLKIGFFMAVLSLMFGVGSANAANLTFSSDTTIAIGANNYIIYAGSEATSMVVDSTTITVTVPASSIFTFGSSNRFVLNNDQSVTSGCSSSVSNLTINGTTTSAAVVITPDTATTCTVPQGGGGGGGGTPTDTTPPTNTSVSVNAGVETTSSLSTTLALGATDATQMLISNDAGFAGASWETYATSKSWTLVSGDGVKTVYAKFRDATGNMSVVVSDSITVSGTGTVTVVINEPTSGCSGGNLYNVSTGGLCVNNAGPTIPGCGNSTIGFSTATGQSCIGNRSTSVSVSSYNFGALTLKNGSRGEAVMELQRFLNRFLNLGLVIDGKLGPKTIAVIKKWQKSKGLVADGLIGAKTKAKMNIEASSN